MRRVRICTCAVLLSAVVSAQTPTAEITGRVSDATVGAVVGATVTITNTGTNAQRVVTSNSSGSFDAPALPPGVYSVKVAMAGFKTEALNNVELQVNQVARLDFTLQIGNVTETVEVQAEASALQTETASVGTVVENRRIVELPLNGRNYLQLASLVPGVTTYGPSNSIAQARSGGDRSNFTLNVAGQRLQYNHYALDGIENTDPNYATYLFAPSVDALEEFKVETGTYSAEYGHGVGQVNVITKSGTNQYHGSLFEFLRNSRLDAKNFFDKASDPIPPFKRNQFGGTAGGPIMKNKLFFFFNYEGLRQRKAQTALSTLPFGSDRTGNFAGSATTIYDPATRVLSADGTKVQSVSAFPGNIIPANRISPIATFAFQNFYPLPNNITRGYTNDFLSNEALSADADQQLARVDWTQSSTSSFQFRYSHGSEPQYIPANIPQQGNNNGTISHQSMLGHTWVLGSNKVNEFKFGVSRLESANSNLHTGNPQYDYVSQLNLPALTRSPLFYGIPFFQISNFTSAGDPANGPYLNWDTVIQFSDNFAWNKGKHNFKFGAEFQRTRYDLTGNDVARGRFTFGGQYTSLPGVSPQPQNAVSDFLLGIISNSEGQLGQVVANLRSYSMGYYFQDQWKLTPHLTINYGLRYEFQPGYSDKYDHLVNLHFKWDNSITPTLVRAGSGDPYAGNPGFPVPSTIPYVRDGRFGSTTNRPDYKNWGPRLGIAYSMGSKTVIRAGAGLYYVHEMGNVLFDMMRNQPFTLRIQTASNSLVPDETWARPFPVLTTSTLTPAWEWGDPTPYVPQWSLNVQRQITRDMSLEVGYVGSSGVHLNRIVYYNEPGAGPPGNFNLRRPFPTMGFVQLVEGASHSSYDSLNVRLQQRFAHGFTVLSSYSYGKSIDNGSGSRQATGDAFTPSDNNNLRGERGLSAFDFRQRSTTSFLYELPVGKGKALLGGANRVVNAVAGGWQMGGIFTLQAGFPFSVNCSSNATYQNNDTTCRADAVGTNPALASDLRGPNKWFNTAAFVSRVDFVAGAGPYRAGNAGRNVVIGPGITELDLSMAKTFHFTERIKLEFRGEFFNIPNHPILGQPGGTVGNPTYGVIGSTRLDSRQIQFGMKLAF
jgi:Carboxypeptidase regulatory-like domain/TonB-dependent Receptor Plug Domain